MARLPDTGVLVTRPVHQSDQLVAAIEHAGGHAIRFPVIEIVGRPADHIGADERKLPRPDIVIFVSSNAVSHGVEFVDGSNALYAAVGPATKSAIESFGLNVHIYPDGGYDSEHLLQTSELQNVAGCTVRIVRGKGGRELLAETLGKRGARVNYLEVYRRVPHEFSDTELSGLQRQWLNGDIHCVIAMSVESLEYFLIALPADCRKALDKVSLVTPSKRVIQTAMDIVPEMETVLAAGPGTDEMLEALAGCQQQGAGAKK